MQYWWCCMFPGTSCRWLCACASCTVAGWLSVPNGLETVLTWTHPVGSTYGSTWSSSTGSGSWSQVCCWFSRGALCGNCTSSDRTTTQPGRGSRMMHFPSAQLNVIYPLFHVDLTTSWTLKGTVQISSAVIDRQSTEMILATKCTNWFSQHPSKGQTLHGLKTKGKRSLSFHC